MTHSSGAPRTAALRFDTTVALIGGGDAAPADVDAALRLAGAVVAADGGANRFEPGGSTTIDAIIGDMDSIADLEAWRVALGDRVVLIDEQETTDFEKCLYAVDAPLFIGVGFFGARLDHTVAALNVLAKRPDKRVVLVGAEDVAFLSPPAWRASLWPGARVSILPLPEAVGAASEGLRWPLDGVRLAIGEMIGASNQATSAQVSVTLASGAAAVILERRALLAAIDAVEKPV